MVANLKDTVEAQRGLVLHQPARFVRSFFNDFHFQARKSSVVPESTVRGETVFMSVPGSELLGLAQEQHEASYEEVVFSFEREKSSGIAIIEFKYGEFVQEKLLSNGDIYVGSWQGNLPEGTGKYLWSDGCMYEGEWVKGKNTGIGKISWPTGTTYEGDFVGGYIEGVGTYTGVDDTTYKGSWYMNEKKGYGTKSYANGDFYEGSWNQGLPDGVGRYVWENVSEYFGNWKSGTMSGKGVLRWTHGDKYDGEWLDGLEHGRGVYTWADGSKYVGTWSRGLKDGKGTFFPPRINRIGRPLLPNIEEQEVSGDEAFTLDESPRPRCSSTSDSEVLATRFGRSSSCGSSAEKFTFSTGSEAGLENSPFSEPRWSSDDIFDRAGGLDDEACVVSKESVVSNGGSCNMVEHDIFISSVVEREYVQGVLINELVKKSPVSHSTKRLRRRNGRHIRELARPGEKIFKGHRSYDLMLSLQLGIRYSVGKITPEPKRAIFPSDFGPKARIWMNFPKDGSQLTPPHQSVDFKWKDYCPMVFRHLRELFKIDTADYMLSICGDDGLRELSSPGKSGSVFYLSHDDRFMIKTMRKAGVKVLLGMLPNYYNHVQAYENTLITKFFGLHRIKPLGGQKVRFMVMGNMFCTELRIHRRFDLKGSSQGRSVDKVEMDENTTLKDLDLDFVFQLEASWRDALLRQIECDCKFLESERIMDYSLLLGVHFRAPQFPAVFSPTPCRHSEFQSTEGVIQSSPANDVEGTTRNGLVLVAHEPEKDGISPGPHVRGSPLKAAAAGNGEVDLLLPGTARLRIQLGVNMPARADRAPRNRDDVHEELFFGETYDVVLYFGIIDILQEYDMGKKLEHAYKSLQFDSLSISAVDPSLYSKRFQYFIHQIFPDVWGLG